MYSFLPDEILKEILSPALQISDKSFASTNDTSPFAKYERSTSAYLLVCKDWLRVATPLLYNVVILRSKAQIQALAWALKSTSMLGGFIKKLRIECGYNTALSWVFQASKNLTDLCLSLEIYSQDNVSGICRGLPSIQPHRVILYDPTKHTRTFNSRAIQLVEVLISLIPTWSRLTSFVLPSLWRNNDPNLNNRLKRALCMSPSLQEIHCLDGYCKFIPEFAKIPTIQKIFVPKPTIYMKGLGVPRLPPPVPGVVKDHPQLAQLVAFEPGDDEDNLLWPTPDFPSTPSVNPPSDWFHNCPISVLNNIIYYAIGIPGLQDAVRTSTKRSYNRVIPWQHRKNIGLVCKRFREVVHELDLQHIILDFGELYRKAQRYRVHPDLGTLAQSLFVPPYFELSELSDNTYDLALILSCCPNLRQVGYINSRWTGMLVNFRFDWEAFSTLASSGNRLIDLQIKLNGNRSLYDPAILCNFTHLRNLCLDSDVAFALGNPGLLKGTFRNLETLAYISQNKTFLCLMAKLDLPRLHTARFPGLRKCPGVSVFLKMHGSKLQYLQTTIPLNVNIFEICPNLKTFSVPNDCWTVSHNLEIYPTAASISCSRNHPLEEVHLEVTICEKNAKEYFGFLGDLNLSSFPRLRCITISQCAWPPTEHEIRKSYWIPWAERLKNLYGVDVIDSSGKAWIPRLKVRGRGL